MKSGIEKNPTKSEVIGRCGGDEKTRMTTQNRQKSNAKKQKNTCSNIEPTGSLGVLPNISSLFYQQHNIHRVCSLLLGNAIKSKNNLHA